MTNKELFLTIVERLKTEPFLKGFKFRKRDSSFIKQEGGLRRHIELDHWSKEGVLIGSAASYHLSYLYGSF